LFSALARVFRTPDLRRKIAFTLAIITIYRLGAHVPAPFVDFPNVQACLAQSAGTEGLLSLVNLFSGGALTQLSIFALGIMPYISASIIMNLLTVTVPSLEQLKKEGGEAGRRKITEYTRYGTVALATMQAFGISSALQAQNLGGSALVLNPGPGFIITAVVTLVTGTVFLMWLGEQVTERGVGNGISIIIFAGIVAGLPSEAEWLMHRLGMRSFGHIFSAGVFNPGKVNQNINSCNNCRTCLMVCPKGVFKAVGENMIRVHKPDACFSCNACVTQCPEEALSLE